MYHMKPSRHNYNALVLVLQGRNRQLPQPSYVYMHVVTSKIMETCKKLSGS